MLITGASPSGKATDSDSVIRGFKSLCPNQQLLAAPKFASSFSRGEFFCSKIASQHEKAAVCFCFNNANATAAISFKKFWLLWNFTYIGEQLWL